MHTRNTSYVQVWIPNVEFMGMPVIGHNFIPRAIIELREEIAVLSGFRLELSRFCWVRTNAENLGDGNT